MLFPDRDILPWMVQTLSAEPEQKGSASQGIFIYTAIGLIKQIWNVKDNAGNHSHV